MHGPVGSVGSWAEPGGQPSSLVGLWHAPRPHVEVGSTRSSTSLQLGTLGGSTGSVRVPLRKLNRSGTASDSSMSAPSKARKPSVPPSALVTNSNVYNRSGTRLPTGTYFTTLSITSYSGSKNTEFAVVPA